MSRSFFTPSLSQASASAASDNYEIVKSPTLSPQIAPLETAAAKAVRPFITQTMNMRSGGKRGGKGKKSTDIARVFSVGGAGMPKMVCKNPLNDIHRITQLQENLNFCTSSTTLQTFSAKYFILNDVNQVASWGTVFDQYRIAYVELWLIPRVTENNSATNTTYGLFTSFVDYDDATAITSVADANDYEDAIVSTGTAGHYHKFVPQVAMASYSGAFTSFTNVPAPWIDIASPAVQHYSIKTAWTPTTAVMAIDLIYKLHIEFRSVR